MKNLNNPIRTWYKTQAKMKIAYHKLQNWFLDFKNLTGSWITIFIFWLYFSIEDIRCLVF